MSLWLSYFVLTLAAIKCCLNNLACWCAASYNRRMSRLIVEADFDCGAEHD
jgi:hypothetical protein